MQNPRNEIIYVLQKSAFENELATFSKQNKSGNSGQKSKQSVKEILAVLIFSYLATSESVIKCTFLDKKINQIFFKNAILSR